MARHRLVFNFTRNVKKLLDEFFKTNEINQRFGVILRALRLLYFETHPCRKFPEVIYYIGKLPMTKHRLTFNYTTTERKSFDKLIKKLVKNSGIKNRSVIIASAIRLYYRETRPRQKFQGVIYVD